MGKISIINLAGNSDNMSVVFCWLKFDSNKTPAGRNATNYQ